MTYDYNQQPPAPMSPLPYAPPGGAGGGRPGFITGLAVTSLILGVLLLTCMAILGALTAAVPQAVEMLQSDDLLWTWAIAGSVIRVVLGVVVIVGAIGLLSLKPWSRKVMIGYAVAMLLTQVLDIAISAIVQGRTQSADVPAPNLAGQVFGYLIWIGHAVWILAALNTARARDALSGRPVPAAAYAGYPGYAAGVYPSGPGYAPGQQPYGYPEPGPQSPPSPPPPPW